MEHIFSPLSNLNFLLALNLAALSVKVLVNDSKLFNLLSLTATLFKLFLNISFVDSDSYFIHLNYLYHHYLNYFHMMHNLSYLVQTYNYVN